MAGKVNLDPAKGMEIAEILVKFCDVECIETAQIANEAIRALGDDNNCGEQLRAKMAAVQDNYNNNLVPAFNAAKAAIEEFVDVSEYISKLQIETKVTQSDVPPIGAGQFDAARNL